MGLKPGDRIGAIADENEKEVKLLGYGIYEGDFASAMHKDEPMPRLKLDGGKTIWGFLCTWGSEDRVKREIGNRKIVEATMHDALIASLRNAFEECGEMDKAQMEALLATRIAMVMATLTGSTTDVVNKLIQDDNRTIRVIIMAQAILLSSMIMGMGEGSHPNWKPIDPMTPLEDDRKEIYEKILHDLEGWINRSMHSLVAADDFEPIYLLPLDDVDDDDK